MKRAAARASASASGHGVAEMPSRAKVEAFELSTLDWAERSFFLHDIENERRPIAGAHMLSSQPDELRGLVRGESIPRRFKRAAFLCTVTPTREERASQRDRAIQRVLRSAAQKTTQLRGEDEGVEGIVVIEPGWLGGDDAGVRDLLDRVGRPLIERHARVRAVVLVEQSSVEPLLEYSGTGTSSASQALLNALRNTEHETIARVLS